MLSLPAHAACRSYSAPHGLAKCLDISAWHSGSAAKRCKDARGPCWDCHDVEMHAARSSLPLLCTLQQQPGMQCMEPRDGGGSMGMQRRRRRPKKCKQGLPRTGRFGGEAGGEKQHRRCASPPEPSTHRRHRLPLCSSTGAGAPSDTVATRRPPAAPVHPAPHLPSRP